jgi:hypothetical protein
MSTEVKMLPVRQKEIVDKIKSLGFKLKDFKFNPATNETFVINYLPVTDYYISIQNKRYTVKPAQNGTMLAAGEAVTWDTGLKWLDYWLRALKENIEVGNPWEDIEDAKEQMNEINFDTYEEVFNEEEQTKIEKKLDQLLLEITKLNIDTTEIKKDIVNLNTMSGKVSKKDWVLLLMGTVTSWVFSSLLSPEHTQTIWETVKTLFSGFKSKLIA